jgi:ribonuclease HIII
MKLGRGVSASVKEAAAKLVEKDGPGALRQVAKVHFRTAHEIAPESFAAPPPRVQWRK